MSAATAAIQVSAGDLDLVANVDDAACHPGGTGHRVMLGPGADMARQRDGASVGSDLHVAVVGNHRGTVQRLMDVQVDVDRVGVVADIDVVPDVADAGQPGDRLFRRSALYAVAHRAGQRDVAVADGGLHAVRHGDVQRQRVIGRGGQHRVVAEV